MENVRKRELDFRMSRIQIKHDVFGSRVDGANDQGEKELSQMLS